MGLTETLVLRDGDENSVLARREIASAHFRLKYLAGALSGAMQKMDGRSIEAPLIDFFI